MFIASWWISYHICSVYNSSILLIASYRRNRATKPNPTKAKSSALSKQLSQTAAGWLAILLPKQPSHPAGRSGTGPLCRAGRASHVSPAHLTPRGHQHLAAPSWSRFLEGKPICRVAKGKTKCIRTVCIGSQNLHLPDRKRQNSLQHSF